jgi:hypothetical protein
MQDQHQGTTMTGKTITRADLTEAVYDTVSISRPKAADLVEQVLAETSSASARPRNIRKFFDNADQTLHNVVPRSARTK